jgi:hypothetical protein
MIKALSRLLWVFLALASAPHVQLQVFPGGGHKKYDNKFIWAHNGASNL